MIYHITFQSNLYAHRECKNRAFTVSPQEIRQFIGVILLSGYNCQPEAKHDWSTQPDIGAQGAISCMSHNRFMKIKKYLHLADNQTLVKGDKMSKVTPLYKLLNSSLVKHGMFHEKLSVDESIVPYFGRHATKMILKGKPIRFGYKLWMLCGNDGYPHHMIIYQGSTLFKKTPIPQGIRCILTTFSTVMTCCEVLLTFEVMETFIWQNGMIVPSSRIASNFLTNRPLRNTQRRVKGQRIEVQMPNIVRSYNTVVAWRIHCFVEERPLSHLKFRRQVVLSLLQSERTATPRVVSDFMSQLPDIRFDGVNHILGTGPQGRCKKCNVRLHAERGKQCFESYHQIHPLADNLKLTKCDKMSKVTPLYNMLNRCLAQFGVFRTLLSVDEEAMVPYFGRHSAKTFIHGKPFRFGYKFWMLCGNDSYPYHMSIYQGKNEQAPKEPLGTRVVTDKRKEDDPDGLQDNCDTYQTYVTMALTIHWALLLKADAECAEETRRTFVRNAIFVCMLKGVNSALKYISSTMIY
ncbi:PiggyBac transposable element-derived protein [Trichinella spiralis]|uniref:PiggyBac transposable element-derived protein n=1 Tax=Trichinella spiralis TaxID=6334 RepID=A0ABR3KR36_TRISP